MRATRVQLSLCFLIQALEDACENGPFRRAGY